MALQSGIVTITSKLGFPVGRSPIEDHSLLPKRVVILPKGIEDPKWEVERVNDGDVILKIGGAHTTDIDGGLFAVLLPEPGPTRWKLEPQFHQGKDTYTVVLAADPILGWYVPGDEPVETKIVIRPLIASKSLPPFYPPQELFVITPVEPL